MNVQLLDRPLEAAGAPLSQFGNLGFGAPAPLGGTPGGSDAIARVVPPSIPAANPVGSASDTGGLGGLIGSLLSQIASLLAQFFGGASANEQYFANAQGGSVGDPHLSFNGSTWDNMQGQGDLLQSDSIPGGYQLSTSTTAPDANGVTYNQQASITTNFGQTCVSLDKTGAATVQQNGTSYPVAPGTSYDLGNGEFVSRDQNGTLTVTTQNGIGGQITTTMQSNGVGVDVRTSANNLDLGGTLVNGAPGASQPPAIPSPIPTPIRYRF